MTTFRVPLPLRELSSNGSHGHWTKTSRARKQYRAEVEAEARKVGLAPADRVRVSLVFGIMGGRDAKRYQPRDVANALSAFKAGIDGLIDAGMAPDDSREHLELGRISITAKAGPWVTVTVEPAIEQEALL